MRILLTGGTGFIGQSLVTLLSERDIPFRLLARNSFVNNNIESVIGDLRDPQLCKRAMLGVDTVIHVAGEKRITNNYLPVNVQGTLNLLTAAISEGIRRFVYLSSVGVIGADPLQDISFDENSLCKPRSQYERSKREAEKLVQKAGMEGLPVAILRPANVFGAHDTERHLLRLARSVRDGHFVYLGGRDVICNYVFVDDVAHACLTLAEHPNAMNRIYHISNSCTLGDFVDAMSDEIGVARHSRAMPGLIARPLRSILCAAKKIPGLSESSIMARLISLNNKANFATSRLSDELGYSFPVGWREGVKKMITWYRTEGVL